MSFFNAYQAVDVATKKPTKPPAYLFESTAPYNIEDTFQGVGKVSSLTFLTPLKAKQAIYDIATYLATAITEGSNPDLVIFVHGFNMSEEAVLQSYSKALDTVSSDPSITKKNGTVCVGYRWPSEKVWMPVRSTREAMPVISWAFLIVGLAAWLGGFFWWSWLHAMGLFIIAIPFTAVILRAIVYFRDTYRATHYGAPDLVEIIRQIHNKLGDTIGIDEDAHKYKVGLSFIGHSMGGFVVTNVIRILSDVFDPRSVKDDINSGSDERCFSEDKASKKAEEKTPPNKMPPEIGKFFSLHRLVLASPDIPAETLILSRANFLASALRRFGEAYLFSNEGDEILRSLSTIANSFSFNNKTRKHGYRLGNVSVVANNSKDYGFLGQVANDLNNLRVGSLTLGDIYQSITEGVNTFPKLFTYFDCTNYIDKNGKGILTFARKNTAANKKMNIPQHFWLFISLLWGARNVHGGYFDGDFTRQLIYRLACLGFSDTEDAYKNDARTAGGPANSNQLHYLCSNAHIKVLGRDP